jgi:hypothetical protein
MRLPVVLSCSVVLLLRSVMLFFFFLCALLVFEKYDDANMCILAHARCLYLNRLCIDRYSL